jgi:predicted RNA binding protein YcfA (HicA-like mRNA interferase family)
VKLPRDVSGRDVVKALERLGFQQVRQTGSHIQLVRGNLHVTVPAHSSFSPGTLRSVLRQAQVDLGEFVGEL